MKVIVKEFRDSESLFLLPLGDLHWDAAGTDREMIAKKVKEIKEMGYRTGLIGDVFNKLFFEWLVKNTDMDLNEALETLVKVFEPIRSQIDFVCVGNHDMGIEKKTGFSIVEAFATRLNVPVVRGIGILHYRVGKYRNTGKRSNSYIFAVTHGWGGGRKKGSKANKSVEFGDLIEGVDGSIIGHVHDPMSVPYSKLTYDAQHSLVSKKVIRNIVLSSFLGYPEYAQQKGYSPSANIEYLIELDGSKKKIEIHEREF